jgi:hypothetical protein
MTDAPFNPAQSFPPGLDEAAETERDRRRRTNGTDDPGLGEWDAGEDDAPIPPRGWLLGNLFCRRFVSSLLADGAVGKTSLRLLQLLSLATGRPLSGDHVFQRCRVLIVSLEDGADELRRRIQAACLHHGIGRSELKGWLFLSAPDADAGKLAVVKDGAVIRSTLADRIAATIERRRIDVVSIDPFVKAHGVDENSNREIDSVTKILADLAIRYDCAVDVPHHTTKGPADAGNANRGRGAGAFKDGGRLIYTLCPMSPEEAQAFGIPDRERRQYIRMDSGKVNIAPAADDARWFRLVGVPIHNGTDLYPNGDTVQTVEPWTPPDTWAGLTNATLNEILTAIDAGMDNGERYSGAGKATDRAAWRVVLEHAPDKTEKQAREIINTWLRNGVLYVEEYESPRRRERLKGLRLNAAKRPS